LFDLDGQQVELNKYYGKTVFINFWATWCKPCIEEMPSIQNAITALSDKEIVFLFASDETKEEIETFISANNYRFKFLTAGNMEELNVRGLPTTFIFDANGRLVFSEMGARKWDSRESIALLTKITDQ
jgi:thiol-disulfide isomerase/thioredoxin